MPIPRTSSVMSMCNTCVCPFLRQSRAASRTAASAQPPPTQPVRTLPWASMMALEPALAALEPTVRITVATAYGTRRCRSLSCDSITSSNSGAVIKNAHLPAQLKQTHPTYRGLALGMTGTTKPIGPATKGTDCLTSNLSGVYGRAVQDYEICHPQATRCRIIRGACPRQRRQPV